MLYPFELRARFCFDVLKGGILLLPFPASADESYTSAIIPCVLGGFKRIRSSATVSIVSPIRWSCAENGITGISIVEAPLRQSLTICQFRRICWPYLLKPRSTPGSSLNNQRSRDATPPNYGKMQDVLRYDTIALNR